MHRDRCLHDLADLRRSSDIMTVRPLLRVEMLGALLVRVGDRVISRFRTRRVASLLAFLAYHRGQSHDRARVGELLWPDADPDKVGINLRQALASLRRQIECSPIPHGGVIHSAGAMLSIDRSVVQTDVAEFEEALGSARAERDPATRRAHLERAVALYRGELLPGHGEEWVLGERMRLEDLYTQALHHLAQQVHKVKEVDSGIDMLHRAIAKDPYNERFLADLMRWHLEMGQASSALKHYREFKRRLDHDLGMQPDIELRSLARLARQRVPQETPAPTATTTAPVAIVPDLPLHLPVQLTRIFGRKELSELLVGQYLSAECVFTTLLGPAGVGKTTLAVATARLLAEQHGWQATFVPLADLDDASPVPDAVSDALRVRRDRPGSVYDRIRSGMGKKPTLIVLDNAEHMLEGLASVVAALRSELPELRLLITSRQSLKVSDEHEVVLDLLDVPDLEEANPECLAKYPSVALFVDRARALQPDFALTARNARIVGEICARLDGLPLAIELAAGLSNTLTPAQMLAHLNHRLEVLRTRRRDAPHRHRSLSVALDYSFERLTTTQRRLFSRLSVFRGGFSQAAAAVVVLDGADEEEALRALMELQERSLISSDREHEESSSPRFRMLESFREYGQERLSPAQIQELARKHAEHFLSTVPQDVDVMRTTKRAATRLLILQDRANYWHAILALRQMGRQDDVVLMLAATTTVGPLSKPDPTEYEILRGLDFSKLSLRSRARVAHLTGMYQHDMHSDAARSSLEMAVDLARKSGDVALLIRCLASLSNNMTRSFGAEAGLEVYREIHRYEGTPGAEASMSRAYNGIGTCLWMLGRLEEAEAAFRKGLAYSMDEPGDESDWLSRYNIARVLMDRGKYNESLALAADADRIALRQHDAFGHSLAAGLSAHYRWKTGDIDGAIEVNLQTLAIQRRLGIQSWVAISLRLHGLLLADKGEPELAAVLLAATARFASPARDSAEGVAARIEKIKASMPEAAFRKAWERGLSLDLNGACELVAPT
jgi:predicted ATPase/DNA-binding SARP family transcriptional activator